MMLKPLAITIIVGVTAGFAAPRDAEARDKRAKYADEEYAVRDCTPFNGPSNYYGNPWCDDGWKFSEDYAPGTGPYYDLLDLPQIQRLRRRRY